MSKLVYKISAVVFVLFITVNSSMAQCAMCRISLENNVSNGEAGIGASINFGILYLLAMPYLLVMFIAYMWYKKSKENASKQYSTGNTKG